MSNVKNVKTQNPPSSLSDLYSRLSRLIKTEPIDQMSLQLQQQNQQNARNCLWLDEAFGLLNELSAIDEPEKAPQIIAKIESFISKAQREDYHEDSQIHFGEQMYGPGSEMRVSGEIPKKN